MSRSTRLFLICHGPTTAARNATFPHDEPLVDGDIDTIHAFIPPDLLREAYLVCSPARSTVQIAEAISSSYEVDHRLADLDHGLWSGRSLEDVARSEPEALKEWMTEPDFSPPEGESIVHLIQRSQAWLDGNLQRGGKIVAITHRAVCRAMIVSALGAPADAFWKIDIGFPGKTTLTSDGRRWSLSGIE
ncbi:histidine phosphatase family protein [Neorhizobium sp. NCHU2750]|uniref:histidine phosphatase family protein n=1 Tax=Neorhizobium sp. NCHU2750 TaxID=1825976 RepID=UPI000E76B98A|nr:histidine phosphatase [Neorhizobium sp. NCHU2750]